MGVSGEEVDVGGEQSLKVRGRGWEIHHALLIIFKSFRHDM